MQASALSVGRDGQAARHRVPKLSRKMICQGWTTSKGELTALDNDFLPIPTLCNSWSSLVEGNEGCISPSGKLFVFVINPQDKNNFKI